MTTPKLSLAEFPGCQIVSYIKSLIPEGYTFKYTEGNNVSDLVARIDLVIDISGRVGLQKAYCPFRFNLSSFSWSTDLLEIGPSCLNYCLTYFTKSRKVF